jgi:MoaA/NifB/PqqE/SkfB family radical SAM enzyme
MCLIAFEKGCTNIKKALTNKPIWAYLSIIDRCDKGCPWCYARANPKLGEMKLEDFEILLKKFAEIGIKQVSLSGGEPTLHSDIIQFIKKSSSSGFKTHLLTSGLTSQFNDMIEMDLPFHQVQFNWHVDSYKKLLPVIKQIKSRNESPVIAVTIVGSKENIEQIDELLETAISSGINKIRIWDQAGPAWTPDNLSIRNYYELAKPRLVEAGYTSIQSYDPEVQDNDIEVKISCLMTSKSTLFVSANGDVCPVPLFWTK